MKYIQQQQSTANKTKPRKKLITFHLPLVVMVVLENGFFFCGAATIASQYTTTSIPLLLEQEKLAKALKIMNIFSFFRFFGVAHLFQKSTVVAGYRKVLLILAIYVYHSPINAHNNATQQK